MPAVSVGAAPGSANQVRTHFGPTDSIQGSPQTLPASPIGRFVEWTSAHVSANAWQRLIASDSTLFAVLLAVNAWALPYAGLVHDARLYGIQVLNRVDGGSFANDLYLRFGSQDRFTHFSLVAAPLVYALGLQLAFFLIYLAANAVFIWGALRLVALLCNDRLMASVALLLLATTHIPFAGLENFYVNENFVTPRLAANGLVLWGLARLLEGKSWSALVLLLFAAGLHPLMACGGLVVWMGFLLVPRLSSRSGMMLVLVGFAASSAFLLSDELAGRFLGRMDSEWREAVRRANPYNFPSEWAGADWGHLLAALGIATAACAGAIRERSVKLLVRCIAAVAIAGVVINVVASRLPYALPIQGQGYRWLWLLQYLEAPLGLLLIRSWWQQGTLVGRVAAVILVAYLGALVSDRSAFLALLPCVAAAAWFVTTAPGSPAKHSAFVACLLAVAWLTGYEITALHTYWVKVGSGINIFEYLRTAPTALLAAVRVLLALGFVLVLGMLCRMPRRLAWTAAIAALLLQASYFTAARAAEIRSPMPGVPLARDYFLAQGLGGGKNLTLYWPIGWINHIWFDLHADSYYEPMQIAGNVFSRGNAIEGERRIKLVKRFEIERIRDLQHLYSPLQLQQIEELYQAKLSEPAPSRADVLALFAQEDIDFLLLRQGFAPWYVATDGHWFLYDCRAVRASQDRPADKSTNPISTAGRDLP
jgi:hypothetical protein